MGRPEGPRCYCYVNNLLRKSLDSLSRNYAAVVVDNEAGMEHLSRRTTNDVDLLIAVMNPTLPSLRAAQRIVALSRELPVKIDRRAVLVNRVGPEGVPAEIDRELAACGVERLADVPAGRRGGAAGPPGATFSACLPRGPRWRPCGTSWKPCVPLRRRHCQLNRGRPKEN